MDGELTGVISTGKKANTNIGKYGFVVAKEPAKINYLHKIKLKL